MQPGKIGFLGKGGRGKPVFSIKERFSRRLPFALRVLFHAQSCLFAVDVPFLGVGAFGGGTFGDGGGENGVGDGAGVLRDDGREGGGGLSSGAGGIADYILNERLRADVLD